MCSGYIHKQNNNEKEKKKNFCLDIDFTNIHMGRNLEEMKTDRKINCMGSSYIHITIRNDSIRNNNLFRHGFYKSYGKKLEN